MNDFILYITTAIALIFIIEGLIYALFTEKVKAMLAIVMEMPVQQVRTMGFSMAAIGLVLLVLLQQINS